MDSVKERAIDQAKGSSSVQIHTEVLRLLKDAFFDFSHQRFLDIGTGTGEFAKLLKKAGATQIHGCDLGEFNRPEFLQFKRADLNETLPYGDSEFDVVTAIEVLEHLENPRKLIREADRILKAKGTLILSTPNLISLTSKLSFLVRGYHSAFGPKNYPAHITPIHPIDFERMLSEAGFESIYFHSFGQGRIPGTGFFWPSLGGILKKPLFSDNLIVAAKKKSQDELR